MDRRKKSTVCCKNNIDSNNITYEHKTQPPTRKRRRKEGGCLVYRGPIQWNWCMSGCWSNPERAATSCNIQQNLSFSFKCTVTSLIGRAYKGGTQSFHFRSLSWRAKMEAKARDFRNSCSGSGKKQTRGSHSKRSFYSIGWDTTKVRPLESIKHQGPKLGSWLAREVHHLSMLNVHHLHQISDSIQWVALLQLLQRVPHLLYHCVRPLMYKTYLWLKKTKTDKVLFSSSLLVGQSARYQNHTKYLRDILINKINKQIINLKCWINQDQRQL